MQEQYILLIHCPDREGLVASVTSLIRRYHGNVVDLDQHVDTERGVFFMRVAWNPSPNDPRSIEHFEQAFNAEVAGPCAMVWRLERSSRRGRMAVFVSKFSHCLHDILSRWESGEWQVDIPLIVSNHRDLEAVARRHGIRFEHVPVTAATKAEAERRQLELLSDVDADFVVLARYMQILSPEFLTAWEGQVINIHHSFLPAFAGGQPYHAANARGVKIIGATSHYVTAELDAGPIIAQDVTAVSQEGSRSREDSARAGCVRPSNARDPRLRQSDGRV